ncbi:MAG: hypothetical protein ACRYGK_00060 [Janthinobacterium lividum]
MDKPRTSTRFNVFNSAHWQAVDVNRYHQRAQVAAEPAGAIQDDGKSGTAFDAVASGAARSAGNTGALCSHRGTTKTACTGTDVGNQDLLPSMRPRVPMHGLQGIQGIKRIQGLQGSPLPNGALALLAWPQTPGIVLPRDLDARFLHALGPTGLPRLAAVSRSMHQAIAEFLQALDGVPLSTTMRQLRADMTSEMRDLRYEQEQIMNLLLSRAANYTRKPRFMPALLAAASQRKRRAAIDGLVNSASYLRFSTFAMKTDDWRDVLRLVAAGEHWRELTIEAYGRKPGDLGKFLFPELQKLARDCRNNQEIHVICNCQLDKLDLRELQKLVAINPAVKTLMFNHAPGQFLVTALESALTHRMPSSVTQIVIDGARWDVMQRIVGIFGGDCLELLDLKRIKFKHSDRNESERFSSHCARLQYLYLDHCGFGDDDMPYLIGLLHELPLLQGLNLAGNDFRQAGMQRFGRFLASNKVLKNLLLHQQHDNGEGAVALTKALKKNISIDELCLSLDGCSAEEAGAFARVLEARHKRLLLRLGEKNNYLPMLKDVSGRNPLITVRRNPAADFSSETWTSDH